MSYILYFCKYICRGTSVPRRLAKFLLDELKLSSEESKSTIELKISKHDLASYLGTIDETLSRCLKKLQENKVIIVKGKKIQITDRMVLKKAASE